MSFGKSAASFSDTYLASPRFAFFLILTLFISLPFSSFSQETSDKLELQRHLFLITKKTIVFENEVDAFKEKSKTKESFQKNIKYGLDYGVKSKSCEEMPTLIGSVLKNLLSRYFEGISPDINFSEEGFDNSGASSLNLIVAIHSNGKCVNHQEGNR
ncbi:hypothetical protein N9L33_00695 [Nitrospinae bacterium]|jgi:hypothetical protein|nr:hypothetical protein [Nitrospinota bacterium]